MEEIEIESEMENRSVGAAVRKETESVKLKISSQVAFEPLFGAVVSANVNCNFVSGWGIYLVYEEGRHFVVEGSGTPRGKATFYWRRLGVVASASAIPRRCNFVPFRDEVLEIVSATPNGCRFVPFHVPRPDDQVSGF